MKVIGLCGGSGSGKGVVSSLFDRRGIPAIDTDTVYRELTSVDSPCNRALSNEFGKEIISTDGSLNRKKLRTIVFTGDDSKLHLKKLNEITHKYILDETRNRLDRFADLGYKAAIVDAPALFESGFDKECDIIISVIADREVRISRIMLRDNIDRITAEARINSQIPDEDIISRSDFVIKNDFDLETLEKKVEEISYLILNN